MPYPQRMHNNHGPRSCFIKFFSDMIFKTVDTNQATVTAHKEYQGQSLAETEVLRLCAWLKAQFMPSHLFTYLLVIPIPQINELIAVADTPRRRSPASVNKRGSSHPSTHFSVTSRFNCNRTRKWISISAYQIQLSSLFFNQGKRSLSSRYEIANQTYILLTD